MGINSSSYNAHKSCLTPLTTTHHDDSLSISEIQEIFSTCYLSASL